MKRILVVWPFLVSQLGFCLKNKSFFNSAYELCIGNRDCIPAQAFRR